MLILETKGQDTEQDQVKRRRVYVNSLNASSDQTMRLPMKVNPRYSHERIFQWLSTRSLWKEG